MWINPEVNLPEGLLSARQAGDLVIFAGAGVSIGPPSNLPDFRQLADRVSAGSLTRDTDEPDDRYLGRLEAQGVDVMGRTRSILGIPGSAPTRLHRDLIALFPSCEKVRVVTTNFDEHFSTAASDRYPDGVETYFAPALPLGRDFTGIVYLHGSLAKRDRPLVLTDREFGRAYLTDGWATRMLLDMFSRYTVLFVGYSHRDPVMTYLARSLVAGTQPRYALTEPGEALERWWSFLGVTPVTFPLRAGSDRYGALSDAISDWGMHAQMGALDHEARIRDLLGYPPPLEQESVSYLEAALQDPVRRRFFLKHARSPEWLEWAERQGLLDELFSGSAASTPAGYEIAHWFATRFAIEHPTSALEIVQRKGPDIAWDLWQALARELALRPTHPAQEVFGAWITVLVQAAHPRWARPFGGFLLQACRWPDDRDAAVLLLGFLSRPRLRLEPSWGTSSNPDRLVQISGEVGLAGEQHELQPAWEQFFAPNIEAMHHALVPILTGHLNEAHSILRALGSATDAWDPMSFRRSAIEPHEQDLMPGDFAFLVDAARATIEWLVHHLPERGSAVVEEWGAARTPLLQRLAIHGLIEQLDLRPDAALRQIERRNWLYAYPLKHEIFRLIERAYPGATSRARSRFIQHSMEAAAPAAGEDSDEREVREYSRYNVAVWLRKVAPGCPVTERHFKRLQKRHPEFAPREYPDLDHWSGGLSWGGPTGPFTAEELLLSAAEEQFEILSTFQGEGHSWAGPTREGLLEAVRDAAGRSFEWGWGLAEALERRNDWASDLWASLLRAWSDASLEPEQWQAVLTLLERTHRLDHQQTAIRNLLQSAADRLATEIAPDALAAIERITDRLMAKTTAVEYESSSIAEHESWLGVAINRPVGRLTLVWLRTLASRRRSAGDSWSALPSDYRRRFDGHLDGESTCAELGRVVLASQILTLFDADPDWTRARLLTLFDWTQDARRATQAWQGFLTWGRWNESLFSAMLPLTVQSFRHTAAELKPVREGFVARLSGAAMHSSTDPLQSGWLQKFAADADPETRGLWATRISHELRDVGPEAAAAAWARWIEAYWALRLTGVPRPLSPEERAAMSEWPLALGEVFPQAVSMVCAAPTPSDQHGTILYRLRTSELAVQHPTPAAQLVLHLLSAAERLDYQCTFVDEIVRRLAAAAADQAALLSICEQMARLSCHSAADLRAFVLTCHGTSNP